MHCLQSSSSDTPLEDAVVLFRVHVERLFVDRVIILNLVNRRFGMLLLTWRWLWDGSRLEEKAM
jgi:hypothetical protein